jgi:hypothetical protein
VFQCAVQVFVPLHDSCGARGCEECPSRQVSVCVCVYEQ